MAQRSRNISNNLLKTSIKMEKSNKNNKKTKQKREFNNNNNNLLILHYLILPVFRRETLILKLLQLQSLLFMRNNWISRIRVRSYSYLQAVVVKQTG